jgi:hypothetical protein
VVKTEFRKSEIRKFQGTAFCGLVVWVWEPEDILGFDVTVVTENLIRRLGLQFGAAGGVLMDCHNSMSDTFALLGYPEDGFLVHGWRRIYVSPISP